MQVREELAWQLAGAVRQAASEHGEAADVVLSQLKARAVMLQVPALALSPPRPRALALALALAGRRRAHPNQPNNRSLSTRRRARSLTRLRLSPILRRIRMRAPSSVSFEDIGMR